MDDNTSTSSTADPAALVIPKYNFEAFEYRFGLFDRLRATFDPNRDDLEPTGAKDVRSGPFHYGTYGFVYGRWDIKRADPQELQDFYAQRDARPPVKPQHWLMHTWLQAQLRHYGVFFRQHDSRTDVLLAAIRDGLCNEPPQKIKTLERRLAAAYQRRITLFNKLKKEWKERDAIRYKQEKAQKEEAQKEEAQKEEAQKAGDKNGGK